MFRLSGDAAKPTEQAVNSIMRFEVLDVSQESAMDVLALVRDFVIKVVGVFSEREIKFLGIASAEFESGVAQSLVKRMPEITRDAIRQCSEFAGNSMLEAKFEDLLAGLRIDVIDDVICANVDKLRTSRFKIEKVFFSACEE